jgi:alpha-glucosidase
VPRTAEWWRHAVIYQIYPRSFADFDGDGVGDLRGITSRLPYLAGLGVDAIWLSPFYPSPQADAGYDVMDHCGVDPAFGTLAQFDTLLHRAHELGLRVIIDLVPNHTSDRHPWFRAALAARPGSPERDRYLFRTGRGPYGDEPPNNWLSLFGGSAWTRVAALTGSPYDAAQWYLHLFDSRQPDLNWDNRAVRDDFVGILRFWLDRGVDGFRVDVAHGMVKDPDLPDWTPPGDPGHPRSTAPDLDGGVDLGPMFDQPGVHDIYREWNRVLAGYPGDRALVAEACVEPVERVAHYVRPDEMQQAFNFAYMQAPWQAVALRSVITDSLRADEAVGAPTTWVLSNHDVVRHASLLGLPDTGRSPDGIGVGDPQPDAALGLRRARAAILLTLALPGSTYLYQGEELGLPEHTTLDDALRRDPVWRRSGGTRRGRDGCRVPLPWSANRPAFGFNRTGRAWLPQPAHWSAYAVDAQEGVDGSTLELYRAAIRLRRAYRLGTGALRWLATDEPDVLSFRNRALQIVVNLSGVPVPLPAGARPLLASADLPAGKLPADSAAWLLSPHGRR